jgi:biotin transporter BioY
MALVLYSLGTPLAASKAFYMLYMFFPIDLIKLALSVLLAAAVKKRAPGLLSTK